MEENQRKGPGVFYAVVGVATLVVAIIGATFAYFSASTSGTGDTIGGSTQNINGASLTLTVDRIHFTNVTVPSDDLVPAYFGSNGNTLNVATPANLTSTQVSSMLTNKCVNSGFTGCHVYRITISADQNVTYANLLLDLSLTGSPTAKDQWGYVVFKANEVKNSSDNTKTDSLTLAQTPEINVASHGAPDKIYNATATVAEGHNSTTHYVDDMDIHNSASLTVDANNSNAPVPVTYYLLVYVNDTNVSQNTEGANYVVGGYAGTLELQTLGGKVRASFGA